VLIAATNVPKLRRRVWCLNWFPFLLRPRMICWRFANIMGDSCHEETRLTRLLIRSLYACLQRAG